MSLRRADLFLSNKIPSELTEATGAGGVMSLCAVVCAGLLLTIEFMAYLSTSIVTSVALDPQSSTQLRINFNISLPSQPCDFATVDMSDVLGTNRLNITKNIEKWGIDKNGRKRAYQGRNRGEREYKYDTHHPELEEMHENGVHAVAITKDTYTEMLARDEGEEFTFVDFYAPWCVWCQRLESTWEALAESIEENEDIGGLAVAKVDCVEDADLCRENSVMAFPTLRMFRGEKMIQDGEYKGDRTVKALTNWAKAKMKRYGDNAGRPGKNGMPGRGGKRILEMELAEEAKRGEKPPGCMIAGHIMVNRVPGNFHVEARSKNHNINPTMANLSHIVNALTFGEPLTDRQSKTLDGLEIAYHQMNPLDGREYMNDETHQAFHHYLKVVNTEYRLGRGKNRKFSSYQVLGTNQLMKYGIDDVPEARFAYDLSPIGEVVTKESRKWYDFLTQTAAIIGGTITVMGMLDSAVHKVVKRRKAL